MSIYFDCNIDYFPASDEALIIKATQAALEHEFFTQECEININITNNKEIRELNKQYRGIDKETDVLSFPMYTVEELKSQNFPGEMILGDIVISIEKAEAQAKDYGHGKDRELAFLTVHSVLHLLGYDHETLDDEAVMIRKQEEILSKLGMERK